MNKVRGTYSGHNHFSDRKCTSNSHVSYLQRGGSFCYGNNNMNFCLTLTSPLEGLILLLKVEQSRPTKKIQTS